MTRGVVADTTRRRARLTAVAVLVVVTAPHMLRPGGLPAWVSGAFLGLAALRAGVELGRRRPPPRWLVWALAALVCLPAPVAFGYYPARDLFLALLALLAGLKVLEARTLRDWAVAVFLSQFLVLTNFLYTQSVLTALYLVGAVWLGLVALADLNDRLGAALPPDHARLALRLLAQALPLTAALFLLFPRVQGQLWRLPGDRSVHLTGLSEELAPGAVQRVALSDEVAFRVAFQGEPPAADRWYWRGLVLDRTDGDRWWWSAPDYPDPPVTPLPGTGATHYTVTLEPHGKRWLFGLDLPAGAPPGERMFPGRQLVAAQEVWKRRRYTVESYTGYRTGEISRVERDRALAVPRTPARVRALAVGWAAGATDDGAVVERALRHFASGGYTYTLAPPVTGSAYVDPFLFETRQGFCEHFAGSFALLMRLAGVPSRVVVGYLGGEFNPVGEFWVVRQAQAHAWAEVWLDGRGWVRVDPTAMVQPERLTGLVDVAAGTGAVAFVRVPADWVRRALGRARVLWGAAENTWDQWVLGYDLSRQVRLLRRLGVSDPSWWNLAAGLGVCAACILVALAGLAARRSVPRGDPLKRAYDRLCRRLGRRGLPRGPAEAPLAYARRAAAEWPAHGPQIEAITVLYLQARYGSCVPPDALGRMCKSVRRLRPRPQPGSPAAERMPIMKSYGRE